MKCEAQAGRAVLPFGPDWSESLCPIWYRTIFGPADCYSMQRFYLHHRSDDRFVEDPDGSVLPDLAAARQEAITSAREILAERLRAGKVLDGWRFEITDESGKVLDTVLFREVVKST